jgi:multidrug efflux pump subunit AcrA (membrane-fusion protein)
MKSKISSFFRSIWANKGKKKVWIPAVIVIIVLFFSLRGSKLDTGAYIYAIQPKEFVQTVSLTGKVIAAKNVDMGFETAGRVSKVNVQVGSVVKQGQILASLENGDYTSSLL